MLDEMKNHVAELTKAAQAASFVQVGPGTYQKWNPALGIRTTVIFKDGFMHVRHEQPKQLIADILDLNVKRQNDFKGYGKGDDMFQATSLPWAIHKQVMAKCGFKEGQGYDIKKFKQIMNDSDYSKLKVVPGKI